MGPITTTSCFSILSFFNTFSFHVAESKLHIKYSHKYVSCTSTPKEETTSPLITSCFIFLMFNISMFTGTDPEATSQKPKVPRQSIYIGKLDAVHSLRVILEC